MENMSAVLVIQGHLLPAKIVCCWVLTNLLLFTEESKNIKVKISWIKEIY